MHSTVPAHAGNIIVVGSINLDLAVHTARLPGPGETVTGSELNMSPGGKSSNQAAAAALLGSHVHLVGAVGNDSFGERVIAEATAHGVNLESIVQIQDCGTGTALIAVDAHGENNIISSAGANARLTPAHVAAVPDQKWADADVLCLALEVDLKVVMSAARCARDSNTLVMLNPSPLDKLTRDLLTLTDVLVLNEHELTGLLGSPMGSRPLSTQGDKILVALTKFGITRCVVTLGSKGALVLDASAIETVVSLPALPVHAIDTTGCGDAFTGALAHGLARGQNLVSAARLGTLMGAYAAQHSGAQLPYPGTPALERFSLSIGKSGLLKV